MNNYSSFRPEIRACLYSFLAISLIPALTFAQVATTARQTTNSETKITELSPFVVTAEDNGWIAGNTMLSNRTNQSLRDVPVTIDALTPDFLQDVGAYDAFSAASWVANGYVEDEGTTAITTGTSGTPNDSSRYAFRGVINEGGPTRNLFSSGVSSDMYNIARIDFGRGSNSLLFGDSEPGGQGNIYTKRANIGVKHGRGNLLAQVGSFDSYRFNFDYNLPITPAWSVRLALTKSEEGRDFDYNRFGVDGIDAMTTWQPWKNTMVRVDVESTKYNRIWGTNNERIAETPAAGLGFNQRWTVLQDNSVVLNTTLSANDRKAAGGALLSLRDVDAGGFPRNYNWGPDNHTDQKFTNFTAEIEQKIGPVGFQLSFNQEIRANDSRSTKMNNRMSIDSTGRRYIDFTYNGARTESRDRNYQGLAVYDLHVGDWMSQYLVATVQRRESDFRAINVQERNERDNPGAVNAATARIWYRVYVDEPGAYDPKNTEIHATLPETDNFKAWRDFHNNDISQYKEFQVYSLSASGKYLGGRLLSTIGARWDLGNGYTSAAWTAANRSPRGESPIAGSYAEHPERFAPIDSLADIDELSKNLGLVYKLTKSINVYTSYAESFRAANGADVDFTGEALGQQRGETYEVGIKSEFFNQKLAWNLNWYDLKQSNVAAGWQRIGITEDELEDVFNPNGLSSLDPAYVTVNGNRDKRNLFSKGVETTLIYQPVAGLRLRIAGAYKKVNQNAAFPKFRELLAAAEARGNEDPVLLAAAEDIIAAEGAKGNVTTGRAATEFTFNYVASYQFGGNHWLKGFAVGVNGNYNGNYIFRYLNNIPYSGGERLSLNGMASYRAKVFGKNVVYRLNVSNIIGSDYESVDVVARKDGSIAHIYAYGARPAFKLTATLDF